VNTLSAVARCCAAAVLVALPAAADAELTAQWNPTFRLRHEYFNNNADTNDTKRDYRSYLRLRTTLSGQLNYGKDYTALIKLTNENRIHMLNYSSDKLQNASTH
jgi:hypothetical protein